MKKKVLACLATGLLFLGGYSTCFASTVWLDEVILFDQPSGSSNEGNPPIEALGASDATGGSSGTGFVSIDIPEILIVAFTDNSAIDGSGNDIRIYEYLNGDSLVDVHGSMDNSTYVYLGRLNGTIEYDIADYVDLHFINYLKFVGLDNGGGSAGFDLDAVEALNSGAHVPIPGAVWMLGSGIIGLAGFGFKRNKK